MEYLLVGIIFIFAISFLLDKATSFIKQLKSGSARLLKGFEARLAIVPIEQKSEESVRSTISTNDGKD